MAQMFSKIVVILDQILLLLTRKATDFPLIVLCLFLLLPITRSYLNFEISILHSILLMFPLIDAIHQNGTIKEVNLVFIYIMLCFLFIITQLFYFLLSSQFVSSKKYEERAKLLLGLGLIMFVVLIFINQDGGPMPATFKFVTQTYWGIYYFAFMLYFIYLLICISLVSFFEKVDSRDERKHSAGTGYNI